MESFPYRVLTESPMNDVTNIDAYFHAGRGSSRAIRRTSALVLSSATLDLDCIGLDESLMRHDV